ncbi:alpha-1,2-mannosyltransferase ALG9 [Anthonomus grandis grandis]|uniref:alpha-1,2-mannosyltransferase ALG9 n=1 Tax=Anthonomus grandis grandis TaxID=2921223 RepID=UPI00216545D8|nr:alpha-1,2-mannosyltransferase ALG9 [Anthonomus grandis grandis]
MVKSQPSFRLRQNASQNLPRSSKKDIPKKTVRNVTVKPEKKTTTEFVVNNLTFPSGDTAFKALLSARFCAAIWSHISDCDETFNYWEPTHYIVFTKGLQTWEYSPQYALRSYLYLMIHAIPAWIYHKLLQPNPLLMFYFSRCLLGMICAFAEVFFYKAVCKEFGVHIGRICLAFQLFSPGMFIASTAYLPSSFAMYNFTAACAAWWQQKYALAIFFTALGSLLGWPFAALLGVPIAYDILIQRKMYTFFLTWCGISAIVVLGPMILADSLIYGRLVIAPLNIVKYNVLGGAGPELYGTEPFSFYLINGLVNFNIVWILALLSPLAIILNYLFVPSKSKSTLYLPHWLSLSPMFLWLAVFMFQKHKEERFLFPIYPMICLAAAITLDVCQKLIFRIWSLVKKMPQGTHYLDKTTVVMMMVVTIFSVLGISRIVGLYKYYHAPMDLMMELNRYPADLKVPENTEINVCFAKDWHRFPGSFFLPNTNWDVRFIKSEFDGMLPAPYSDHLNATKIIHPYFNDENKEDLSLYFDISKCHFLLDLDLDKETALEPIYAKRTDDWKVISSYKFLNAEKSNRLARAFYVPFVSERFVSFGNFSLLRSLKHKII